MSSASPSSEIVLGYICRFHDGVWQLLVSSCQTQTQKPPFQVIQCQTPAGELFQKHIENEIYAQTGLQDLMNLTKVDEFEITPDNLKPLKHHCFLFLAPHEDLAPSWSHHEQLFFWTPIAPAIKQLVSPQGRSIKNVMQFLFQRDQTL